MEDKGTYEECQRISTSYIDRFVVFSLSDEDCGRSGIGAGEQLAAFSTPTGGLSLQRQDSLLNARETGVGIIWVLRDVYRAFGAS